MIFKLIDQSLAFQRGRPIDLQDGVVVPSGFSILFPHTARNPKFYWIFNLIPPRHTLSREIWLNIYWYLGLSLMVKAKQTQQDHSSPLAAFQEQRQYRGLRSGELCQQPRPLQRNTTSPCSKQLEAKLLPPAIPVRGNGWFLSLLKGKASAHKLLVLRGADR